MNKKVWGVNMALWIVFGLCLLVELICVPWYLKALWPEKCRKSLVLKMICSTAFVIIGVISMFISNNFSPYSITMVIGLVLGWIGDYFLHAKPTNAYFATGFISFFLGHIAYIVAYVRATPLVYSDYKMFNAGEIIVAVIVLVAALVVSKVFKVNFSPKVVKYAIAAYFTLITFMLIRASALGYCYYANGGEYGVLPLVLLSVGAVCFVLSDATLGIIGFGGQKKNYPLKIFNILTYFWGQVMLASSILFINA